MRVRFIAREVDLLSQYSSPKQLLKKSSLRFVVALLTAAISTL